MGKLTFRRVVTTLKRTLIISSLPIAGGTLFLLGSFCFWPGSPEVTINVGALCFLVGSLCYWAAPFLDFWELTHNYGNLLDSPPEISLALETHDTYRMAAMYEHLYKSHLLRIQCANCLVYMLGGGFFVAGSTLFFPQMAEIIYHGGWLYITGCVLTLAGALLAMLTAFEMRVRRAHAPAPAHTGTVYVFRTWRAWRVAMRYRAWLTRAAHMCHAALTAGRKRRCPCASRRRRPRGGCCRAGATRARRSCRARCTWRAT